MTPTEIKLRELLTTYPKGLYLIDTLEISHSLFSQRYFFTREPGGITATITNKNQTTESADFVGTNFEPVLNQKKSDLDSDFSFTLADPDNILDDELDKIPLNDLEKIEVIYRSYNSDDFTAEGDLYYLEALSVNQEKGVFTVNCGAPQLNWNQTGIRYDYDVFPMLRALI